MSESNNVIATQMEQLYALYTISAVLQQMYDNLALVEEGQTGQVISVNNVSLFYLAAKYYGDATSWTVIAEANGLSDPYVFGLMPELTIPPAAISTGGILSS